jgi:hypothetical protein
MTMSRLAAEHFHGRRIGTLEPICAICQRSLKQYATSSVQSFHYFTMATIG